MKYAAQSQLDPQRIALCAQVLPLWGRLLATAQAQSETAVAEMLAAFSEMTPILNASAQTLSAQVSPDSSTGTDLGLLVERMYVGFQYQDRISQMLALLQSDMQRMLQAITELPEGEPLQSDSWLQRLESQYAMGEQRLDHHGQDGNSISPTAHEETTFF